MDKYTYTLNREAIPKTEYRYYHKEELELMTTYQLREICQRERIINGIQSLLDKDELIRQIMRFRGRKEHLFIKDKQEGGIERLESLLKSARIHYQNTQIRGCAKLTVYEGLAVEYFDRFTIGYDSEIADTNALLVSGNEICAIFQVCEFQNQTDRLYLTKTAEIECKESSIRNYTLYCMGKTQSDLLYRLYMEEITILPEHLNMYCVPVMNFQVRERLESNMPLAIDFGTSNTTAGIYLDAGYLEQLAGDPAAEHLKKDAVNYVTHLDVEHGNEETPILPTVAGVIQVGEKIRYAFGHQANKLFHMSYIDEGFCIFYDIKRWIGDYEKQEEIIDSQGRRSFVKRKDILKAYFDFVINETKDRFKCEIRSVHISCPVKQKAQFQKLFEEILPEYAIEKQDMIDEGVSVLYGTISEMIQNGQTEDGEEYKALIIDCGGGTTDLCSCRFRVWDKRVSYRIEINTSYENGDTDFGGNNLTYRMMQLIKVAAVERLLGREDTAVQEILAAFDRDVYRFVDAHGSGQLYEELERRYGEAEACLPTRFREYENRSRADYYKVKNNFYFLFQAAERMKKEFFNRTDTLRIALSSAEVKENATRWIPVDRWKLSFQREGRLETIKEFQTVYFSVYEIELLLKADIYGIIRRFMEEMYENRKVEEYSIIKLTGQSCKISLFRSALKEFVPGRTIQFKRKSGDRTRDFGLKMTCVDGALQYLRDRQYGFADVSIRTEEAALPYQVTAYTHSGEEVTLIHSLKRDHRSGMISRNMENLVLKLYLRDLNGKERCQYTCYTSLADFTEKKYEEIEAKYADHIRQADTDTIVDREVKFFVWARPDDWAFAVVPVYRRNEKLFLGKEEEFFFENDRWVQNFFDGMK